MVLADYLCQPFTDNPPSVTVVAAYCLLLAHPTPAFAALGNPEGHEIESRLQDLETLDASRLLSYTGEK